MAAVAHSFDDAPIDPAEDPMPEAAFQAIQRAHEICGHPPARESQRGDSAQAPSLTGCLIAHATKILRSQIRAGELLREMKLSDLGASLGDDETDEVIPIKLGFAPAYDLVPVTYWQQVTADAWNAKRWKDAATDYRASRGKRRTSDEKIEPKKLRRLRALLADDVSLQRAYAEISSSHIKGRAADSTVEALLYGLRSGVSALKEPDVRRRLSQLSDDQLVEVGDKLCRRAPEIGGAWTANEIQTLMQLRETLRDENR
jgi:hypothetical protein